jgi:hypothetical protein
MMGGHAPHVPPYAPAMAAVGSWSGPVHAQLEGPGMPVARSLVAHLTGPGVDGVSGGGIGGGVAGTPGVGAGSGIPMDAADAADEGAEADDGRLYCWCQVGSYGDMVACDDNECEREWVSVSSLFLFGEGGCVFGTDRLTVILSSTWGVSGSTWPLKAFGSARRAEAKRRIDGKSLERRLRVEEGTVRMAILGRRVRPPQPDRCPSATIRNLGSFPHSLSLLPYSPCQLTFSLYRDF